MAPAACIQCGYPTGLGLCLMCHGESERICFQCFVKLPQQYNDYLCESCGLEAGPKHLAEVAERRARMQATRTCDNCGHPMYAGGEPACPICQLYDRWGTL